MVCYYKKYFYIHLLQIQPRHQRNILRLISEWLSPPKIVFLYARFPYFTLHAVLFYRL